MPEFGLYYPCIDIQDDVWLKAAALYWPVLGRMVPAGHAGSGSRTAKILRDELNFFVDIDPRRYSHRVSIEFESFVMENEDSLRRLYAIPYHATPHEALKVGALALKLEWIYVNSKMDKHLVIELQRLGLATRIHSIHSLTPDPIGIGSTAQIGLHPRLGLVYLAALADQVARANDMSAITDQYDIHGALNGWAVGTLAQTLLDTPPDFDRGRDETYQQPAAADAEEVRRLYAAIAINTVVPKGLEHIQAEQIVRARRALAQEFDAFRAHLDSMDKSFTELAEIESPEVLRARLQLLVDRDLRRATDDLERGLRGLGMEPARAVLGMKSLELPATVAAAAAAAGVPVAVGQAGLVAAQLVASTIQARATAQQQRQGAAGYLLGLREEFNPRGVVDQGYAQSRLCWSGPMFWGWGGRGLAVGGGDCCGCV